MKNIDKRKCGNSEIELSVLGMGCWAFGGGEYWGDQNQNDVNDVVRHAVECGINYFDTAEAYNQGRSEQSLGEAIKGLPRDKIIIGTKISPSNTEPENLKKHLDDSLRRLGTDYIDIYMVHWPITPKAIAHFTDEKICPDTRKAFETLIDLKNSGKIREIGVSNYAIPRMEEIADFLDQVCVNELPYSLLTRGIEINTLDFLKSKKIGVIGYMTLLQGILADIYPSIDDIPVWQRRTRHFNSARTKECRHGEPGAEVELGAALDGIRAVMKETGLSMPELAIKWVAANPDITCALVGARSVNELNANINAVTSAPLSTDVIHELNRCTQDLLNKLGAGFDYYESVSEDRTV
ncbi:MAG: aldo/keto reductase [Kiritimatiellales bacterium]